LSPEASDDAPVDHPSFVILRSPEEAIRGTHDLNRYTRPLAAAPRFCGPSRRSWVPRISLRLTGGWRWAWRVFL